MLYNNAIKKTYKIKYIGGDVYQNNMRDIRFAFDNHVHSLNLGTTITPEQSKKLMSYFGVDKEKDLVGKTFESDKEAKIDIITDLITRFEGGERYSTPLGFEQCFAYVTETLAAFKELIDLTIFNPYVFEETAAKIVNSEYLQKLKDIVSELSHGEVTITESDEYNNHQMSDQRYLVITNKSGEIKKLVVSRSLSMSRSTFWFINPKRSFNRPFG